MNRHATSSSEPSSWAQRVFGGRYRWWWRAGLATLLLAMIPAVLVLHYSRPHHLKPLLEARLSRQLGGPVTIGQARMSLTGRLTLESVWLEVPPDPATPPARDTPPDPTLGNAENEVADEGGDEGGGLGFSKLFEAERIEVQLGLGGLLVGELRVQELVLQRPQLHVIEDVERGVLNLEMLRPEARPSQGLRLRLPPAIDLDAARIRFAEVRGGADGRLRTLEAMRLAGELRERPAGSRRYDFTLRQYDESARVDATLSGRFDAGSPSLELNLDGFEMALVHRQLLPRGLRRWWDQMQPAGRLPRLRLQMKADAAGRLALEEASMDLAGVSLTPPWRALDQAGLIPPPPPPTPDRQAEADGPLRVAADGSYVPVDAPPIEPAAAAGTDAPGPSAAGASTRMTQVSGRLVARRDRVQLQDLTGVVEGVQFHVQGRWGLEPGSVGRLRISTDPFVLPPSPKYLPALPAVARVLHHRLQPSGRFQIATVLRREAADAPVEIDGTLKVLGARSRFHEFPYPLQDLRGLIRFDRDAIRLDGLVARGPDGGTVTLDGEISPPTLGAAVRMSITARDVPFDELVRRALKPEHLEAASLFFDPTLHATLVDEGVIRSAQAPGPASSAIEQRQNDPPSVTQGHRTNETLEPQTGARAEAENQGAAPVFDLGGALNVRVLIDKPRGQGVRPTVTTRLEAAGLGVLFRHWPYPLVGRSGAVVIRPGRVDLEEVVLSGVTGGRGTLRGHLEADPDDASKMIPHLRVQEAELPIDTVLLHSIRGDVRQPVADLHAQGRLTGEARVEQPPGHDRPLWQVDAQIHDAAVQPYAGRFRLSQLTGGLTLNPDGLVVHDVAGQRGHARLQLAGRVDWGGTNRGKTLQLSAEDLRIEPAILDVLPPDSAARQRLGELFDQHAPDGVTDLQLQWQQTLPAPGPASTTDSTASDTPAEAAEAEADTDFTVSLQPRVLELDYRGDRLRFPEVGGEVVIRPGHARLNDLDLRFATGTAVLQGLVGLDGQTPSALTFDARADSACPYTRKFLPPAVVTVLDRLEFAGDYHLQQARLYVQPPARPADGSSPDAPPPATEASATESSPTLEFEGKIQLTRAKLTAGLPVTGLQGTLGVAVQQRPGEARPRLGLTLDAQQLRVADRRVAPLRLTLDNHQDPQRLTLHNAMGGVYGGVLVLEGSLPLDPAGRYRLDLALNDVRVDPFLRPAEHDPTYEPPTPGPYAAGHPSRPTSTTLDTPDTPDADAVDLPFSNQPRPVDAGLLSASLVLESPMDRPLQRLGRGALRVRDARLFDKPLSTALLRATSFALPSGAPLDAASARYLVDGPTVYFDQLSMSGPGIRIEGGGTLSLPETDLDLVMVPRATQGPRLGPISDLIDFFKDELIAIHVTGTIAEPQTDVASLTGLTRGWTDSFGQHRATLDARDEIKGQSR